MGKSLYLVSGEISGDVHGAEVMRALRERLGEVEFAGVGGPDMAREGKVRDWVDEAAVVGLWEVLKKYGYFKREFERVRAEIRELRPDAVVLIDYPGFNLRLAKVLREDGMKTRIVYYISPQVWAWNRGRIPKMAKYLDLMICIFPFEKALYEESGLRTVFAGHPMVDRLNALRTGEARDPQLVGFFPGSRTREVAKLFPVMLETAKRMRRSRPELRFAVAAASEKMAALMRGMLGEGDAGLCQITVGSAYALMQRAGCAAVASGTASLEAAFFGLPYVLVYRVSGMTYRAARLLMKVPFLGMVNILAGREVVREFLQDDCTAPQIADELLRLGNDPEAAAALGDELRELTAVLGGGGAHDRAAEAIVAELERGGGGEA